MKLFTQTRYVTVASTLALVVAAGGTSYAAGMITGRSIEDGTITTKDIRNQTLRLQDLSVQARSKLQGSRGPAGPAGPTGPAGPAGPSSVLSAYNYDDTFLGGGPPETLLSLDLPAGSYLVVATLGGQAQGDAPSGWFSCNLQSSDDFDTGSVSLTAEAATGGLTTQIVTSPDAPTTATLACSGGNVAVYQKRMTAVRVGSATQTEYQPTAEPTAVPTSQSTVAP